jgi:hypothetical protein
MDDPSDGIAGVDPEWGFRRMRRLALVLLAVLLAGCSTRTETHIEITLPPGTPGPIATAAYSPFAKAACTILTAEDFGRLGETVKTQLAMDGRSPNDTCSYSLTAGAKVTYLMLTVETADVAQWAAIRQHAMTYWSDSVQTVPGIGDDAYSCFCGQDPSLVVKDGLIVFSILGGSDAGLNDLRALELLARRVLIRVA